MTPFYSFIVFFHQPFLSPHPSLRARDLFCLLEHPLQPELGLAHGRCSVNIYWMPCKYFLYLCNTEFSSSEKDSI